MPVHILRVGEATNTKFWEYKAIIGAPDCVFSKTETQLVSKIEAKFSTF